VSLSTAAATTSPPAQSAADAWVAGFIEGWRAPAGPEAFAAHFREMLAPDVRLIQPQLPTLTGRREFEEQFVRPLFALIPDVRGEVERWAARGETLYIELTLRGSLGGRPLTWRVCDRVTLRDGLAIERESYFDPGALIAAVIRTPSVWAPFLRLRLSGLVNHLRTRRKS
jgi:ketosteroid isomerase-like protein